MKIAAITGHKNLEMLRRHTLFRTEDLVKKLNNQLSPLHSIFISLNTLYDLDSRHYVLLGKKTKCGFCLLNLNLILCHVNQATMRKTLINKFYKWINVIIDLCQCFGNIQYCDAPLVTFFDFSRDNLISGSEAFNTDALCHEMRNIAFWRRANPKIKCFS
jgi:hypothetical protein